VIAETDVLTPTLDGVYYTDPGILAAEFERIFEREWYYAGRADEVAAPGRFIRRRVGRETIVLVRGRDQVIRGFLNVCRHRGAQLCLTDRGEAGKTIRCPYHAWTYGLDGQLVAAPDWRALNGVDRGRYRLHQVHVATWEGLIWVSLAGQPGPLDEQLRPQIEARLAGYGTFERYRLGELKVGARAEYDVAANWKLICENFQECYHCRNIHPELVATIRSSSRRPSGPGATTPAATRLRTAARRSRCPGRPCCPGCPACCPPTTGFSMAWWCTRTASSRWSATT